MIKYLYFLPSIRRAKKHGFSLVEVMLVLLLMSILVGGVMLTIRGTQEITARKKIMEAEFDILTISMAASLYCRITGENPPNVDTLFSKGYLVGENMSPFRTPYKMGGKERDVKVWCITGDGDVVGEMET